MPAEQRGQPYKLGAGRFGLKFSDEHGAREWTTAIDAAGLEGRRIYDLRHSFAAYALAAGLGLYELARYMGTSVEQIDRTYGHLVQGAEGAARAKLDAYADRLGRDRATAAEGQR